jgi:hypothetical protein
MARLLLIVSHVRLYIFLKSLDVSFAPIALLFFDENFIVKLDLGFRLKYALLAQRKYSDYTVSAGREK